MKKKFYVLSRGDESNSATRLKEEMADSGFELVHLHFDDLQVTSDGIFFDKRKIVLDKGDVFWSVNNSSLTRLILDSLEAKPGSLVWPNPNVFKYANKFRANRFFTYIGIPTPKTVFISRHDGQEGVKFLGGFPVVLKRNYGSKGTNVYLVNNVDELNQYMQEMLADQPANSPIKNTSFLLQEFIEESAGSDIRVLCLDGKIIGGIQRTAQSGFKANISLGGTAKQLDVDSELQSLCEKIVNEAGLFYVGLDFIRGNNGYLAIEINTCAQFEGFEKATGINVARAIIESVKKILK
jgi:RimK family alpha-L-glutamate ligase